MKLSIKSIPAKLGTLLEMARQYLVLTFILFFVGVYGFLVFRINTLARSEPGDDAVTEKLQTVQRPKIDQNAVDKIQQLEDQNIEVQTLFKDARQNPFLE